MSLSLLLLVLCVGASRGAIPAPNGQRFNNSAPSLLSPLISSSFGINPLAINFLPAQSKVFFLVPNQTVSSGQGSVPVAPIASSQLPPKVLFIPSGVGVPPTVPDQSSNLVSVDAAAGSSLQPISTSSLEVRNNLLVLHNPFAAVPYQSNTETIASLIESIFSNFSLQSLPPESLIFGALPSPNSTITRTVVQDAFGNDQEVVFDQPTEPTTEALFTDNLFPVGGPFDSEAEVSRQENSVPTLGELIDTSGLPTTQLTTTTERPTTEATPITVTPVAPTVTADFESSRIEPIQTWTTQRRVTSSAFTKSLPSLSPPTKRPRIVAPNFATLPFSQSKIPHELVSPIPLSKPVKPGKFTALYKTPLKLFKSHLPQLKLKANSLFRFELNNKKIVGTPSGAAQVSPQSEQVTKPAVTEPPFEPTKKYIRSDISLSKLTRFGKGKKWQKLTTTPERPTTEAKWFSEQTAQPGQQLTSEKKVPIVSSLVNIISLPNYQFFLGKKA